MAGQFREHTLSEFCQPQCWAIWQTPQRLPSIYHIHIIHGPTIHERKACHRINPHTVQSQTYPKMYSNESSSLLQRVPTPHDYRCHLFVRHSISQSSIVQRCGIHLKS
jgi:hypothetical protein